jgi:hypothetical protein
MSRNLCHAAVLACLVLAMLSLARAQSDDAMSLADVARAARSKKTVASAAVIDNDNLERVVDQVAGRHKPDSLAFTIEQSGKKFDVISPDATCSLSFNANAAALVSAPVTPTELPAADLARVDGPATFDNGTLEITLHNGSDWNLRELTVALTVVQSETDDATGSLRLVPALQQVPTVTEKHPETTMLLHLKGTAAPAATAVFNQKLPLVLSPDQDWHWSILQAKGIPSAPLPTVADSSAGN